MKKVKLVLKGADLSVNGQLTAKYALAVAVDALEEVPAGEVQDVVDAIITGLQGYKQGDTPTVQQWIVDADNLANQIATDTGNAEAEKAIGWVTSIAGYVASGSSKFGAVIKSLFHKHVAPLSTTTTVAPTK